MTNDQEKVTYYYEKAKSFDMVSVPKCVKKFRFFSAFIGPQRKGKGDLKKIWPF
jgi:hypothetical protein